MDWELILSIISGVLFIVSILAGTQWRKAKAVLKEVAEALTITSDALEDDDVSTTERQAIIKEWADVIAAARALVGR